MTYKQLRKKQILIGIYLLIISAIIFVMAGITETKDATPMLITLPLGLWCIFSRQIIIYH